MFQKFIGSATAVTLILSLFNLSFLPHVANADEDYNNGEHSEEKIIYDEDDLVKDSLETLNLKVTESDEKSFFKVEVISNVQSVPSEFPITIVDSDTQEILSSCSLLSDCQFILNKDEHDAIYAQGYKVQSETYYFTPPPQSKLNVEVENIDTTILEYNDEPGSLINTNIPSPKQVEVQKANNSIWSVDLTIGNPYFAVKETFNLTSVSNQNLTGSGYSLYIFDITNDVLIGNTASNSSYYLGNLSFQQGDPSRQYKAYVSQKNTVLPLSQADLIDIQAESGVVTAYRKPWTVELTGTNTTFISKGSSYDNHLDPWVNATPNQSTYWSPYQVFIVDINTNQIVSRSNDFNGSNAGFKTYFTSGPPKTYRAYVALDNNNATTLSELQDVQAYSGTVTFTRQSWTLDASIVNTIFPTRNSSFAENTDPSITYTFNQSLYWSGYSLYVVDLNDGLIVNRNDVNNSSLGHVWKPYWTAGQKSKTFKAYIALRDPNWNNTSKYTNVSQLQEIQAISQELTVTRKDWNLSLGYNTSPTIYGTYNYSLEGIPNQNVYWSGYSHVIHNITDNTWSASLYNGANGTLALDKSKLFRSYIGTPVRSPQNNSIIHGVTDIQAASNTVLVSYNGGLNPDGTTPEKLYGGSNPSTECAQTCAGDPINTLTGEFWEQNVDVSLPNVGVPLHFIRSFNTYSTNNNDKNLGYGWTNNYSMKIEEKTDTSGELWEQNVINITQENNSVVSFYKIVTGEYLTTSDVLATLEYSDATDTFTFTRKNGAKFIFDAVTGRLLKQIDSFGNTLLISYDSQGRLKKITADNLNFIELTYSSGLLTKVEDSSGYYVEYSYQNNNLIKVEDAIGTLKEYSYDTTHKILSLTNANGGTTTNEYDSNDKVIKQTDPEGNQLLLSYDSYINSSSPSNNVYYTTITYPDNSSTFQHYDYAGRLVRETKAYGTSQAKTWKYEYNSYVGKISKKTNPDNSKELWNYDAKGNILQHIDESGTRITSYSGYNAHNNPSSIKDALNNTTSFNYNSNGAVISVTDAKGQIANVYPNNNGTTASTVTPLGYETLYTYDILNNLIAITDDANNTTKHEYDTSGNIIKTTDAKDNVTKYSYDSRGNPTIVEDAHNNITETVYDNASRPVSKIDALNNSTNITYDLNGNILTIKDAENNITTYEYDSMNRVKKEIDPLGSTTEYEYDLLGNLIKNRNSLGDETKYEYDFRGNVTKTTTPEGVELKNVYDVTGRIITSFDAAGNATTYTYDKTTSANLLTVKDAQNKTTTYSYDAIGNLTSIILPDNTSETYTYDNDGRKISYTDSANKTSSYIYDNVNQLAESTIAGINTKYVYDATGNLIKKVQQDNSYIEYSYNDLHQLTHINYSDINTPNISYSYDALGNRITMNDGSGYTNYTYDDLSRMLTASKGNNIIEYEYNAINKTKMVYPSGEEVTFGYDNLHRLNSIQNDKLNTPISYIYNKDSQLTSTNYGNGVIQNIEYADNLAIQNLEYVASNNSLLKYSYDYNSVNLLTDKKVSRNSATESEDKYSFDSRNRLQNKNNVVGFSFDNSNNLLSKSNGDILVLNTLSQVTSLDNTVSGDNTDYSYDPRGNRISSLYSLGSTVTIENEYSYNIANQLVEAKLGANPPPSLESTVNYTYDGDGLLVEKEKTVNSSTTDEKYVWDINTSIASMIEDEDYTYIYGSGIAPLAQINKINNEVEYLHGDSTESIGVVTDSVGSIIAEYSYDEYGNQISGELNHSTTHFGYAGQYLDEDTSFYYMRARWYDPVTAQFLTVDAKLATTNLPYGYTLGNPLQFADPLGLDIFSDFYSANSGVIDNIAAFSAGFGDEISFGLTELIRESANDFYDSINGWDSGTTICKAATLYAVGQGTGFAFGFTTLGVGIVKSATKIVSKGFTNVSSVRKLAKSIPPASASQTNNNLVTVGRWMNPKEFEAMSKTSRLQEGAGHSTRVAYPANSNSYKAAPKGDYYVEFDIAQDILANAGEIGWKQISGPGSLRARANKQPFVLQWPEVFNIKHLLTK